MFNEGKVPESGVNLSDKMLTEKEEELQNIRKNKRLEKEFFKKMEAGELDEGALGRKEPKLLVKKITDASVSHVEDEVELGDESKLEQGADEAAEVPELAPLSNRFSYFENFEKKKHEEEEKARQKKKFRMTPPREGEDDKEVSKLVILFLLLPLKVIKI